MSFTTVTAKKAERKMSPPRIVLDFDKKMIRVNNALYRGLEMGSYPHTTIAFDKDANKLALMRGTARKPTTYKMSRAMAIKSDGLMASIAELTNIQGGKFTFDASVEAVGGKLAGIISLVPNAPANS